MICSIPFLFVILIYGNRVPTANNFWRLAWQKSRSFLLFGEFSILLTLVLRHDIFLIVTLEKPFSILILIFLHILFIGYLIKSSYLRHLFDDFPDPSDSEPPKAVSYIKNSLNANINSDLLQNITNNQDLKNNNRIIPHNFIENLYDLNKTPDEYFESRIKNNLINFGNATILTFIYRAQTTVVDNHAIYCKKRGYRHIVIDANKLPNDTKMHFNHRLQATLHYLTQCERGSLLAVMTDEVLIHEPLELEDIMKLRHTLLGSDYNDKPMSALTLWRHTDEGLSQLFACIRACSLGESTVANEVEAAVFKGMERLKWFEHVEGAYFALQILCHVDPVWQRERTFALVVGPLREASETGGGKVSAVLIDALADRLNMTGSFLFPSKHQGEMCYEVPNEAMTVFNPGKAIGLVMFYTPNMASFGHIAETRLREYATICGYSACIYRLFPEGWEDGHNAKYAKAWVLREFLPHHEWVFSIDADILVQSFKPRLEQMIAASRNVVLTWDVGGWRMNSGLFALQRTPEVMDLLDMMIVKMKQVVENREDYQIGCDQQLWIDVFTQAGWLDDRMLSDVIALNTPWYFQLPDSFMVHYFAVWPEIRSLLMDAAYRRTNADSLPESVTS
jgi:hypothetical protein